jgi:hypothetical protein
MIYSSKCNGLTDRTDVEARRNQETSGQNPEGKKHNCHNTRGCFEDNVLQV